MHRNWIAMTAAGDRSSDSTARSAGSTSLGLYRQATRRHGKRSACPCCFSRPRDVSRGRANGDRAPQVEWPARDIEPSGPPLRNETFKNRNELMPHHGGHPVGCAPRGSGIERFALELVHRRRCCKTRAVIKAVHVQHCERRRVQTRNSRNEDPTTATDQKVAGASTEAIKLHERPIVG